MDPSLLLFRGCRQPVVHFLPGPALKRLFVLLNLPRLGWPYRLRLPTRAGVYGALMVLALGLGASGIALAQTGTTVAGGNGQGSAANQLRLPRGVFVDGAGNRYVADQENHRIQKFGPSSTSASSGTTVAGGNGTGSAANQLIFPRAVFVDGAGNLFVADRGNRRIQKFGPNSTSASSGTTVAGGNGDGSAANQLIEPFGVFVDGAGNLFVADAGNDRIQKFAPNSTSASSGTTVAGGNGQGSAANQLAGPSAVFVDGAGNLFVADQFNHRIQRFAPNSTSASSGVTVAGGNGEGSAANQLAFPFGLFVNGVGRLFVADQFNHRIQRFAPNSTSASSGVTVAGGNGDGSAANQLNFPGDVFVDGAGRLFVADRNNNRIQRFGAPNSGPFATAHRNQVVAVGSTFSFTVVAFAHDTPTSLTYTAAIVPPNGFSFDPATRVISGTPIRTGVSSVTITATDPDSLSASTVFTITAAPFALTGVTAISCETVNVGRGERRLTFTPHYTGLTGQPISFSVVNELLPTTNPGPYVLNLYTDNPTITLKAIQSGTASEASFTYNWLAVCNGGTPPPTGGSFAITGVTTVSCETVSAGERRVRFTPQYAGTTGQPISFSVVNELSPTTAPGPYTLRLYTDNPVITLKATQSGTAGEASFAYNWLAACNNTGIGARVGAEPVSLLSVQVLGNPVHNGQVSVEVRGATGQPLQLTLTDLRGQPIRSYRVEQATVVERHTFEIGHQSAGLLLLQVTTPKQSQTVKVLRAN